MMEKLIEELILHIDEKSIEAWRDFLKSKTVLEFLQIHPEFAEVLERAEVSKQIYRAGFGLGYVQGLLDLVDAFQVVPSAHP